jgi:hypothetical protein
MLLRVGCAAILGSPAVTLMEEGPVPPRASPSVDTDTPDVH